MTFDPKRTMADLFSRHASEYRAQRERMIGDGQSLGREAALDWLAPREGEVIIDLGCGPGTYAIPLAAAVGASGTVVAVDLAEGMLRALRERAPHNVLVALMDMENLGFLDHRFDAAVAGYSFQFCPNLDRALHEIHRVLRPEGRLVATFPAGLGMLDTPILEPIRRLLPRAAGVDYRVRDAVGGTRARLHDQAEAQEAMHTAGFCQVALRVVQERPRYADPLALLRAIRGWWDWAQRVQDLPPAEREALEGRVLGLLESRRFTWPLEVPSATNVVYGKRA
jgi:malonyl-CoA O-methyltransferase